MKDNTSQPFDIADIFALLERDGDGKLSHEEVRLVGCCAMGGFQLQLAHLWASLAIALGLIVFGLGLASQFHSIFEKLHINMSERKRKMIFAYCDKDGSGDISEGGCLIRNYSAVDQTSPTPSPWVLIDCC